MNVIVARSNGPRTARLLMGSTALGVMYEPQSILPEDNSCPLTSVEPGEGAQLYNTEQSRAIVCDSSWTTGGPRSISRRQL
jgi:hypothetical protein